MKHFLKFLAFLKTFLKIFQQNLRTLQFVPIFKKTSSFTLLATTLKYLSKLYKSEMMFLDIFQILL